MNTRRWEKWGLALLCCLGGAATCQAQNPNSFLGAGQFYKPSQYSYRNSVRGIIQSSPTVSPYLTLALSGAQVQTGVGAPISTYQTLVRPQLDQREQALIQERQYRNLQQQVQNLRSDFELNLQRNSVATGHPTRFMTHSHFYPRLDQPRR